MALYSSHAYRRAKRGLFPQRDQQVGQSLKAKACEVVLIWTTYSSNYRKPASTSQGGVTVSKHQISRHCTSSKAVGYLIWRNILSINPLSRTTSTMRSSLVPVAPVCEQPSVLLRPASTLPAYRSSSLLDLTQSPLRVVSMPPLETCTRTTGDGTCTIL